MSEVVNAKVMNDLFNFEPIREQILVPIAPADNVEGRPGLNEPSTDKPFETTGMHKYAPLNKIIAYAQTLPPPVHLYDELFIEGEVTVFFARPGIGKTAFTVFMAESIAKEQPVLYFSYELSELQLLDRATNKETKAVHEFPDKLFWIMRDDESYRKKLTLNTVMDDILNISKETGGKVIIIDNMSAICPDATKQDLAGELMENFLGLKSKGFTVLVLAHPRKGPVKSYELHDIFGSFKIGALSDACFVMDEDYRDNARKFVKQLKARAGRKLYLENNVLCYNFDEHSMHFELTGNGEEWEYLPTKDEFSRRVERAGQKDKAIELAKSGKTIKEITQITGIPDKTIYRWLKK